MRLPDPRRSRVLLIGTSIYDDRTLPSLLSVRNNLDELYTVLTHPEFGGLAPANCRVLRDPYEPLVVCRAMDEAAAQAEDLLLIYYAGHGLLDEDSLLHLALKGSERRYLHHRTLTVPDFKRVFQTTKATSRVLIVDCCHSGQAHDHMGDRDAPLVDVTIDGAYTLTATSRNHRAVARPEDRYTAFTGTLLEILQTGVPDGPPLLPLRLIYDSLIRTLPGRGLPRPEQKNTSTVADLALVRNRAASSPIAVSQPLPASAADRAEGGPAEPTAPVFTGAGRYVVARWVLLSAILVGAFALISVLVPGWLNASDATPNTAVTHVSLAQGLVVGLVEVVAVALALLVHRALPSRYLLTIGRDHVQLQVGGNRDFSYPWAEVAQIRLGRRPSRGRRPGPLLLLLRLQPGAPLPRRYRWAPTPKVMPGHDTHDTLVFADPRRLDTTTDQLEQALEQFAGTAWAPASEVTGNTAMHPSAMYDGPAAMHSDGVRFATRRPRLAVLTAALLAVGTSPLTHLRGDLPPLRIGQAIVWSLLLCVPAVAVAGCVLYPAVLQLNAQGLTLIRRGQTLRYAWQDLEAIAVLPSSQMGLWPPVLFARPRLGSDTPGGAWLPPRRWSRLHGVVVCDLFTLTATRKAVDKALARYADGTWVSTFHPDHGLEDDGDAYVAFHGSVVSLRTILASICAFVVLGVPPPPGLNSVIPAVAVAVLAVSYIRAPCTLTLDPRQIRLTLWKRSVAIEWRDIRRIIVFQTHTTRVDQKGRSTTTNTHEIVVYLRPGAKSPARWWFPWRSLEKSSAFVLPIDGTFLRLGVSADTVDRCLARFAGSRYLKLAHRQGRSRPSRA